MTDEVQNAETSWYWEESVPGAGERPSWLQPKYKSVADQAKSQIELEKMLGATSGAPEEYDLGELKEKIDFTNPHIQTLMQNAKSKRVNNEVFNDFTKGFVDYVDSLKPDFSKEIEKLGPDGAQKIETLKTWAQNNLSESSLKVIGDFYSRSADDINFLDEIRQFQFHSSSQPPTGNDLPSGFVKLTVADVDSEMEQNYKRYTEDPAYRKQLEKKREQATG